jgi:glycine/D-amino acid oxidase-like deaminating enzyme
MKSFDFAVIGGGIAGLITAWELREFNTVLLDKEGMLKKASGAAGAFLFPKIGLDSAYTRFINSAILESIEFYEKNGINTHKKGVVLLPRDERDFEKFKKYEKEIKLPYKKVKNGFYFDIGSVVNPNEVAETLKVNFKKHEVKSIKKSDDYWIIDDVIKTKNIILATGYEEIIDIPYIKIRPVWGERIEIKANLEDNDICSLKKCYFHKNCSIGEIDGVVKIGATHKRGCLTCRENLEEAQELIKKANEIVKINNFEILDIKGGFRAASVDYFPVVGKIIDTKKTLLEDKYIVKGDKPKHINYIEGLYIINGMGGRGFSNAVVCARMLKEHILKNRPLNNIDTLRLFIKWARREGEEYLRRLNVKS